MRISKYSTILVCCVSLMLSGCTYKSVSSESVSGTDAFASDTGSELVDVAPLADESDDTQAVTSLALSVVDPVSQLDYTIHTDAAVYDGNWHKYMSDLDKSDFKFDFVVDTTAYHGNSYILKGRTDSTGYLCNITQVSDNDKTIGYGFEFLFFDVKSGFVDRLLVIPPANISSQLLAVIPSYARDIKNESMRDWRKDAMMSNLINVLAQVCEEPDALSAENVLVDKFSDVLVDYDLTFGSQQKYTLADTVEQYKLQIHRDGDELTFAATDDFDTGYRLTLNDDKITCHVSVMKNVSTKDHAIIVDQDVQMVSFEFDEMLSQLRSLFENLSVSNSDFADRSRDGALVLSSVYEAYSEYLNDDIVSIMEDEHWDASADINNDRMLSRKEYRIKMLGDLIDTILSKYRP